MVLQSMYWSDFVTRSSLFPNVLSPSGLGAEVDNFQRDFESRATISTSTHVSHLEKILTHRKFTQLWDLTRTPSAPHEQRVRQLRSGTHSLIKNRGGVERLSPFKHVSSGQHTTHFEPDVV